MLNKNLALIVLVVFAAGCGLETRTYVMTKDRVGLDQNNGNGGCVMGKCPPAPAPKETTRKVYVLELTRPVPESEVQKIEETAVNAITDRIRRRLPMPRLLKTLLQRRIMPRLRAPAVGPCGERHDQPPRRQRPLIKMAGTCRPRPIRCKKMIPCKRSPRRFLVPMANGIRFMKRIKIRSKTRTFLNPARC